MTPALTDAALPKWIAYGMLGTAPLSKPKNTFERYTTRPYRLVVIKMISNDIQELLKNITKSLIKNRNKELDAFNF